MNEPVSAERGVQTEPEAGTVARTWASVGETARKLPVFVSAIAEEVLDDVLDFFLPF